MRACEKLTHALFAQIKNSSKIMWNDFILESNNLDSRMSFGREQRELFPFRQLRMPNDSKNSIRIVWPFILGSFKIEIVSFTFASHSDIIESSMIPQRDSVCVALITSINSLNSFNVLLLRAFVNVPFHRIAPHHHFVALA